MPATILIFPTMPKRIANPLPNRVRFWRELRGMTLEELAAIIGVHHSNLSQMERGGRQLSLSRLQHLARALGVTVADLLNPADGGLEPEERRFIDTYREVPEVARRVISSVMESQQEWRGAPDVVDLNPLKRA